MVLKKTTLLLMEANAGRLDELRETFARLDPTFYSFRTCLYSCAPKVVHKEQTDILVFGLRGVGGNELNVVEQLRRDGVNAAILMLLKEKNLKLEMVATEAGVDGFLYKTDMEMTFLNRSLQFALERKLESEQLREREELYRTLVKNTPIGIWHIDDNGRTYFMNRAMCDLLEINRWEEIRNETYHRFFTREGIARITAEQSRRSRGVVSSYEVSLLGAKGARREVVVTAGPLVDSNGNNIGIIGSFTDITDRKKAEIQLWEAKERAEEATKLKDKFVSLVAHDLRGPLGSMITFIELALRQPEAKGSENLVKYLDSVRRSGFHMVEMIDNLLNVSRFKTGKLTPQLKFFNGRMLVARVASDLSIPSEVKGITIKTSVPARTRLYGDPALLEEVLRNLLTNSVKFCRTGDTITVTITIADKNLIIVRDTGIGIAPERISTLFSFEERTSTKGTAGELGSGLGLPLCRDIMLAHDGDLTAASAPGEGSTFTASLPCVMPVVMVITNDAETDDNLCSALEKEEVKIISAKTGAEALMLAQETTPHLMILDLDLMENEEMDFLRSMRHDPFLRKVQIIALTGGNRDFSREKAIHAGADDFLSKPISPEDLLARVRIHLG